MGSCMQYEIQFSTRLLGVFKLRRCLRAYATPNSHRQNWTCLTIFQWPRTYSGSQKTVRSLHTSTTQSLGRLTYFFQGGKRSDYHLLVCFIKFAPGLRWQYLHCRFFSQNFIDNILIKKNRFLKISSIYRRTKVWQLKYLHF